MCVEWRFDNWILVGRRNIGNVIVGMVGSCLLNNCVLIEEKRWNTRLLNSGDTRSADLFL